MNFVLVCFEILPIRSVIAKGTLRGGGGRGTGKFPGTAPFRPKHPEAVAYQRTWGYGGRLAFDFRLFPGENPATD